MQSTRSWRKNTQCRDVKIMYKIPNDPYMLLSYINMMLRDRYDSLEELCSASDTDMEAIKENLKAVGYEYSAELNQFK